MSGMWVNDRTHGLQFRATFLKATPPTTLDGIEKYLGSGMIRGIGPLRAKRIIGAWIEQKIVREIMVFLHSHGVGTVRGNKGSGNAKKALVGFRGVGLSHPRRAAMRAPSKALSRRRALCTNWKKPR
jgi:hypothetical protein